MGQARGHASWCFKPDLRRRAGRGQHEYPADEPAADPGRGHHERLPPDHGPGRQCQFRRQRQCRVQQAAQRAGQRRRQCRCRPPQLRQQPHRRHQSRRRLWQPSAECGHRAWERQQRCRAAADRGDREQPPQLLDLWRQWRSCGQQPAAFGLWPGSNPESGQRWRPFRQCTPVWRARHRRADTRRAVRHGRQSPRRGPDQCRQFGASGRRQHGLFAERRRVWQPSRLQRRQFQADRRQQQYQLRQEHRLFQEHRGL